jgi:hypothetical protein
MYEAAGTVYSLDKGVAVPKRLAAELIGAGNLQADLFGCSPGLRRLGELKGETGRMSFGSDSPRPFNRSLMSAL